LLNEREDRTFYSKGKTLAKINVFVDSWKRRQHDSMNADKYDIIFIQREAFMTPSIRFENSFAKSKAKVIYDFDDAIWKQDVQMVEGSIQNTENNFNRASCHSRKSILGRLCFGIQ
jgi:hypothetical protein